ncbi:shikimate dehydrogenase [Oscillibacter sp.]|uniref:shikimate dehydrogenase family protein n=1 Tax=Oscillibacter sp. TaxID=1945593 RepID=UPI00262E5E81|nr:shikimate dehydrogenase [Oscillibacter sp.]MDD3347859.1 shikimate dehydrogenase [Oscillibacter sp.]
MREETVNAKSRLFAILGDPISHSMSPVIMNSSFDRLHMDNVFLACKANLETFDQVMTAMKLIDLQGYVFTMPVKEASLSYMDQLSEEAQIIGAVNCVVNRDGKLTGYNTDSIGFWSAVQEKNDGGTPIQKAFVMGAGGFARAAVAQAALQGVGEIVVANMMTHTSFVESFRHFLTRIDEKCPKVKIRLVDWDAAAWLGELPDCQLVVNATPNGMKGKGDLHEVFPYEAVTPGTIFFDAIYEPRFTQFLKEADARGFRTVAGLDLLAHQGACSFYNWTGVKVSADQMRQDVLQFWDSKK